MRVGLMLLSVVFLGILNVGIDVDVDVLVLFVLC